MSPDGQGGAAVRRSYRVAFAATIALCLLLALAPAVGATTVDSSTPLQTSSDTVEPNDDLSSATDAGTGDAYENLSISDSEDVDYFSVEADDGDTISTDLTFSHAEGDLDVLLLDGDGNTVEWSVSVSDDESITYTADSGGTYYVAVYGYDGATNNYDLSINTSDGPSADRLEPNDDQSSATDVGSGDAYENLSISDSEDEDYFSVDVDDGETVSTDLTFSHAEGDLDVALLDDDGNTVEWSVSVSDDESITYTPDSGGTYYVAVYGYDGATNRYDLTIDTSGGPDNSAPTAEATADPSTATVSETVTLDASGSTDSDGSIESYEWDVDGDGETEATGATNDVSYDSAGTYDATVTVTDDDGATDNATVSVTVEEAPENSPPSADATADPSTVTIGETVTLDASGSSDSDGSIESYDWDVDGDGETEATGAVNDLSYDTAGTYNATVTVTDDDGATDSATVTVTVESDSGVEPGVYELANVNSGLNLDVEGVNEDPGANLIQWPDNDQANQRFAIEAVGDGEYTLTAQHSDLVVGIDDSGNVVQQTPDDSDGQRWLILDDGQDGYVIENVANGQALTVDDASTDQRASVGTAEYDGESHQRWTLDRIRDVSDDNSAPTADATADPSTANVSETVTLDASGSSDSDGSIESYDWDIDGDGETEATGATNDVSYDSAGTYEATVTVTDDDGATDNATVTITVEEAPNAAPSADATADPQTVSVGETVTLDASDSSDSDGSIESYDWDIDGDGETEATGATNDVSYDSAGTYEATVTVTDDDGATDNATVAVTVEAESNSAPTADATADPSTANVSETVTLDASGSSDSDGSIESYEWDIDGDGEIEATGATNDVSYDSTGTYEATVTVTDDDGATDSATVTITVESDDGTCDGTGPDADDDGLTDCEEEELGTDANDADTDGDGLPDGVEVNRTDLLPGADPLQYDVYVETDYFGEQVLSEEEIEALENAFDNDEQFSNPGENGIDLHIVIDEEVPYSSLDPDSYDQYQDPEYECAGYHYAAIGPSQPDTGYTVGTGTYGTFTVAQDGNQSETYMHELGHSLGLGIGDNGGFAHGGTYSASRYQSVMNYNYFGELEFSDGTESDVAYDDWGYLNEGAYNPGWEGDC